MTLRTWPAWLLGFLAVFSGVMAGLRLNGNQPELAAFWGLAAALNFRMALEAYADTR